MWHKSVNLSFTPTRAQVENPSGLKSCDFIRHAREGGLREPAGLAVAATMTMNSFQISKMKKSTGMISGILAVIIVIACALLVLSTLPSKNIIDGNTLVTRYVLGNKSTVDIDGV